MSKSKIVIEQRPTDFHASLKGNPKIWDRGTTASEAIGNLIRTHPKKFGLSVEIIER